MCTCNAGTGRVNDFDVTLPCLGEYVNLCLITKRITFCFNMNPFRHLCIVGLVIIMYRLKSTSSCVTGYCIAGKFDGDFILTVWQSRR